MKDKCNLLYIEMQKGINRCLQLPLPEIEQLECCCRICINYWDQLKAWIRVNNHIIENRKIDFFKNCKPKFTGLIEYYMQRCQAILFLPQDNKEEKIQFWQRELTKIKHFFNEHKEFCEYYIKGDTDRDYIYFMNNDSKEGYHKKRIYTSDKQTSSPYDYLTATLLAYQQYEIYVSDQLKILDDAGNDLANEQMNSIQKN
ncbi:hypothetical protein A3860_14100 [Niastella vici]|uniref:Uncharacterized protein n=1 Tax=Niastella vici TaxID=1703345 RepID=A0A1V9G5A4_9BACT|nr:RteC domain-containing protein [Niastella vici]OQP65732.1 hypothetical protein A3860_14100 [Niastella vici]